MRASVDRETCIGCGLCEQVCPGVFKMVEDKAEVYVKSVPKDSEECAKQVQGDCPVNAIKAE